MASDEAFVDLLVANERVGAWLDVLKSDAPAKR